MIGLAAGIFLMPVTLCAYETDQYTNRSEDISDSTALLDDRVNLSVRKAISNWSGPRNDKKVVNRIYSDIGGRHWVDKIERWAMNSDEVDRLQLDRHDSIYQGHPFWATRVAGLFGVGPTIKLNGVLVGSDKLGHFLSQGRKFYRRYLRMGDEREAAERSAYTERALFGQMTTGVYSNADLVANYEGFLFYLSLFEDDVIPGKPAILRWEGDHWIIQRPFTWADHVNAYWDESINANHYDKLLRPHMMERLRTFCPEYIESPGLYSRPDEESLQNKYSHLQLRDTSQLHLDQLCSDTKPSGISSGALLGK